MELLWNAYCACVVTALIDISLKCTKRDEDLLEDVIIENKQAIEMVEMYSNILMNMMNAFTSIISNNLNMVMKMLAALTITLAVPTIIFSLWGTNVALPFQDDPNGFYEVIGISVVFSIIAIIGMWKKIYSNIYDK